jgi:hypothetical protein
MLCGYRGRDLNISNPQLLEIIVIPTRFYEILAISMILQFQSLGSDTQQYLNACHLVDKNP